MNDIKRTRTTSVRARELVGPSKLARKARLSFRNAEDICESVWATPRINRGDQWRGSTEGINGGDQQRGSMEGINRGDQWRGSTEGINGGDQQRGSMEGKQMRGSSGLQKVG
jgi:hypothetical protein